MFQLTTGKTPQAWGYLPLLSDMIDVRISDSSRFSCTIDSRELRPDSLELSFEFVDLKYVTTNGMAPQMVIAMTLCRFRKPGTAPSVVETNGNSATDKAVQSAIDVSIEGRGMKEVGVCVVGSSIFNRN